MCKALGPCTWHLESTHEMTGALVISPGGLIIPIYEMGAGIYAEGIS